MYFNKKQIARRSLAEDEEKVNDFVIPVKLVLTKAGNGNPGQILRSAQNDRQLDPRFRGDDTATVFES